MVAPRSYVFYGLNTVRALSIIALLLVFASSIVGMVDDVKAVNEFMSEQQTGDVPDSSIFDNDYIENSTVPNQPAGVFWAIVNRLLIIFQVIMLILAEVEWPMIFFTRFFPVLGLDFGLGALGIFQSLIGAAILSHHVDEFSLVSAFFLFSIGCLNMTLGLVFRESAKSKRSLRPDSSKLSLPLHSEFAGTPSFLNEKAQMHDDGFSGYKTDRSGYGFGRQGEKQAGLKGFILTKPEETLPRYAPKAPSERPHSVHSASISSSRRESTHSENHEETHHAEPEHHKEEEEEEEGEAEEEGKEEVTYPRTESPTPGGPKFKSSQTAL